MIRDRSYVKSYPKQCCRENGRDLKRREERRGKKKEKHVERIVSEVWMVVVYAPRNDTSTKHMTQCVLLFPQSIHPDATKEIGIKS